MITFLRRIRKSLINSGATRKYLLYAIGEILLVMIGILLALQVNNWNEQQKDRLTEKRVLVELEENLELNIQKLEINITRKNNSDSSSQIIINAIESKQPYHDSLEAHFGWAMSIESASPMSTGGYETYKNIGIEILENKSLKKEIVFLFADPVSSK